MHFEPCTSLPEIAHRSLDSGEVHHWLCIFMWVQMDLCFLQPLTSVNPHMLLAHEWCSGSPSLFPGHVHQTLTASWQHFVLTPSIVHGSIFFIFYFSVSIATVMSQNIRIFLQNSVHCKFILKLKKVKKNITNFQKYLDLYLGSSYCFTCSWVSFLFSMK